MKIAVVTGASSGLGREFAIQIARKYSKMDEIWVIARRTERLMELKSEIMIPVRFFTMDITNKEDMDKFRTHLSDIGPDIKMLVNCAGYGKIGRFDELDLDEQCGMIDVNCRGLTMFTGVCLPYISDHSRIINIASAAAFTPQPGFDVYSATKAYVLSFSRALNCELKSRKITVTAVCPGPVDTEFFGIAGEKDNGIPKLKRAEAAKVVEKAIKDAAMGNELSVYGTTMKLAAGAAKILPHKLIMNIFKS